MADTKISALTALTGAGTDATADVLPIVDTSVTTSKKILVEELGIALNATQATQEAATSTKTLVSPAVQQYHPSACKAWGVITPPTTVSASYPAAGVSVVKNGTGDYSITHGVTFSSTVYCSVFCAGNTLVIPLILSRTATVLRVNFYNIAGQLADPAVDFSYQFFGDLA